MQITDILAQMGGLTSMAHELGISEEQAATGAASSGLASMLDLNGHANALDDILKMAGKARR